MSSREGERAMALDPQAQEVINLVIKSGRPAYNTLSPKDARQLFRETRPASTPTPAEIGAVKNLTADGPGGRRRRVGGNALGRRARRRARDRRPTGRRRGRQRRR